MADSKRLRTIVKAETRMTSSLTELVIAQLVRLWRGAEDTWYDGDLVLARSARSATLIESAQHQSRVRAMAFLKQVYREMKLTLPAEVETEQLPYPRQGVRIDEVWERPAEQYRYQKSVGATDEEAVEAAADRALHLADTDVSLARRDQVNRVYRQTPRVTGYRRIIHPELSKTGTCGLCIVAADRVYKANQLLPIHGLCNCTTLPVTRADDPGLSLNSEDLEKLYAAAGSNTGEDLKRIRVKTVEHGELGPVIRPQGQKFTDESQRMRSGARRGSRQWREALERAQKAPSNKDGSRPAGKQLTRDSIEAQLNALEPSLQNLKDRAADGEDVAQAIKWQTNRIAKLRASLDQLPEAA